MNIQMGSSDESRTLKYIRRKQELIIAIVLSSSVPSIIAIYIKYSNTKMPILLTVGVPAAVLAAATIYLCYEWKSPSEKVIETHSRYIIEETSKGITCEPYSRKTIMLASVFMALATVMFWFGPSL
mgnify:CR=1 FL=1